MFDSIFSTTVSAGLVFLMVGIALIDGVIASFITSLKARTSKGLFVTIALLPMVISLVFYFLNIMIKNDTTTAIAAVGSVMVGMGLIRFRSTPETAEEMYMIFVSVMIGTICGLGYVAYATIFAIVIPLIYLVLMSTNLLRNRRLSGEKLLKITIPESLEYSDAFDETFNQFLKEHELVGVKTTGMGSMFKLSYRIVMKNIKEEKEMIDELRVKNGNLEISVLPYAEDNKSL